MGTVWLCRDEVLGREVAVKQIGALPGDSATETKRAMREARSAAALNHPNAVAVYDVVTHEGRPWLVMEYVEGETLADEISREGQLSPQRVADVGAQLAGALSRAHQRRIVHRDIKPGNVLIDKAGHPKISDFGIARGHGDEQLTQVGFITGTPGYLSPELARGGDPHPASDVWALGATLYAAVEGQPPYEPRSNPIALLRAIATERPRPMAHSGALGPAIDAMMHEDPACRWDMATSARRLGAIARVLAPLVPRRVDPSVTKVFPAPLVESTQALEPTQRFDAVAPAVAAAASVAASEVARPPVTRAPVPAKPVVVGQVAAKPLPAKPVAAKPVAAKPVAAKPTAAKPVVAEPVAQAGVTPAPAPVKAVVVEPVAEAPVRARPVVVQPAVAEPVGVEQVTQATTVAKPVVAEPVTTAPVAARATAASAVAKPVAEAPVRARPVVRPVVTRAPVAASPVAEGPVAQSPVVAEPVADATAVKSPEPAGPHEAHGGTPMPAPNGWGSGRRSKPILLGVLLAAVLGAVVLFSQVVDQGGTTAAPVTVHPTASTKPAATSAQPSESPAPTSAPSQSATAPPVVNANTQLARFVTSYYAAVTQNRDSTWVQLSPRMQSDAGGRRRGYDGFWTTIRNVRVSKVRPNASANTAIANLTFTSTKGVTSTETHRFTFVKTGGEYLIDTDKGI
jgi:hypothetical protein